MSGYPEKFNQPRATAEEIPRGLERDQSYNRPATVDVDVVGAGAYAAGEIIGGVYEVFDESLARSYDGLIVRIINITDLDKQKPPLLLHLFSEMPTNFDDGDVFSVEAVEEDLRKRRRTLEISTLLWKETATMAYLDLADINVDLDTRMGDQGPFYFVLTAIDGTYTATNGLIVSPTFWVG